MAMAEVAAPERGFQQRIEALERGNAIRVWRSREKKSMTWEKARAWIAEPPELAETMKVAMVLLAIHRVGATTRDDLLRKAGVSHRATLGKLTDRQRGALLDLMP